MDLNKSESSVDTDVLVKIPADFFDAKYHDKSHFSNDNSFMAEIDKFIQTNQQKDVLNSSGTEALSYDAFVDTLHNTNTDQELNIQLVSIFQKKIQNYQQKIAFLTKSLMDKDAIVLRLKHNEGLDVENSHLKKKIHQLEQELADAISLAKRFETKNEMLELKIENLTGASKEMSDLAKKQIHELENRLSNSALVEKELREEINELKLKIREEKENCCKEKQTRAQLDKEVANLKHQLKQAKDEKVQIYEKFDEDRQTMEAKQKKIFSNMMDEFSDKERKLIKELDAQRVALRNYYQAQLEESLEEKVREYQAQINQFQQELQEEAEERERSFNERSIGQLEAIVHKSNHEIELNRQMCREEVELYRIQLLNANRTIDSLEMKLNEYQMRRSSIADNLHEIMESQWKKILDVLSCPSRPPSQMKSSFEVYDEMNRIEEEASETDNNKQMNHDKLNNLSKSEENLKSELLRNYIDKLLKQSPKTDNINSSPVASSSKTLRPSHSSTSTKDRNRPWK